MTEAAMARNAATGPGQNPIRLRTLVRLRWLAVFGQATAVFIVWLVFGFELPLSACLALIALSAWLNVFLMVRFRSNRILSTRMTGLLLAYDVAQLASLLYLTGGLQNPFALLFLVPVTVSATTLNTRWTAALGAMAFVFSSLLAVFHIPLPWKPGESFMLPAPYIAGMWIAVVCGTAFSAFYARRLAEEARQMSAALRATELVLAREQRLSALDGLAAAAAHELGTPLATIALVAKELKREAPQGFAHMEDLDLLVSQAARCREILGTLARREQSTDDIFDRVGITAMLEDLAGPLRGSDVKVTIMAKGDGGEPVLRRNPAITYGLANILENAIDFAASNVAIEARWTARQVTLTVTDDGPGFDQAIFDQLGDPFVTTRPGYDAAPDAASANGNDATAHDGTGHEGMGLGLFIAKTLLERSGAAVTLENRSGAAVTMVWARGTFDAGALDPEPRTAQ